MRFTVCAAFCCVLALPAFAQRGGGHGGGGHAMGGARGFSGGGFHGGVGGAAIRGGGFHGSGFNRGIGFNRGFRGFNNGFGFRNRFFFNSPFLYSGFYGGLYNWAWDYPYYYGDSYVYPYSYAPDAYAYGNYNEPPAVVINQGYEPEQPVPLVREYPPPPATATAPRPEESPLYLIAFKDGIIRAALAYWVEGDQLHYVTMDREMKQVPLNTLDRELSARLNHERHVTFGLPR